MLQLTQGLGFNLADTFPGDRELLPDLFQGMIGVHAYAEAHAQDPLLARGQRGQNPGGGFPQVGVNGRVHRQDGVLVFDEITEMTVFFVTNRCLQ